MNRIRPDPLTISLMLARSLSFQNPTQRFLLNEGNGGILLIVVFVLVLDSVQLRFLVFAAEESNNVSRAPIRARCDAGAATPSKNCLAIDKRRIAVFFIHDNPISQMKRHFCDAQIAGVLSPRGGAILACITSLP